MKLPSSHLAPLLIGLNLVLPTSANVIISEFLAANDTIQVPNAVSGRFDDWVELQNPTETDEDLSGWHLTDDPSEPNAWTFPDGTILPANSFLVVLATGDGFPDANGNLRTNFRLSSGGENILLIRPDLSVASEFGSSGTPYPGQSPDISYGLHPNTGQTVFFETPTPGTANDPDGLARVEELT
ncbi:MAG: lamin tail domain-containing protein, partial [Akkermansiaceae bacterium]